MINRLQEQRNQHIGELRMLSRIRRRELVDDYVLDDLEREADKRYQIEYAEWKQRMKPTRIEVMTAFIIGWAVVATMLLFV